MPNPNTPGPPAAAVMDQESQSLIIRELCVPAALHRITHCPRVKPSGARTALEDYRLDAGDPKDPVERILIEQLVLAHHRLADLQAQACEAKTAELIKVLNAAAVRLMGEVRRFALAIRQYRLPPGQKQFNLIKEQHIQVNPGMQEETLSPQSELNSDPLTRRMNGTDRPATRREAELAETASLVG